MGWWSSIGSRHHSRGAGIMRTSCCPACGGLIGRDCFNPQECMEIVQDQAATCDDYAPLSESRCRFNNPRSSES